MRALRAMAAGILLFISFISSFAGAQQEDYSLYCVVSPAGSSYAPPAGVEVWTRFLIEGEEAAVVAARRSLKGPLAPGGGRCIAIDDPEPGEELYVVWARRGLDFEFLDRNASLLLCGGSTALVRAPRASVGLLSSAGMELKALLPPPQAGSARVQPLPPPEKLSRRSDLVQEIIDRIMEGDITAMIGNLSGVNSVTIGGAPYTLQTRNSYQVIPIEKATRYGYEYFQAQGLTAAYHEYVWDGNSLRNVYAEQTGTVNPDNVVIVCAHVDDMPEGGTAPGADDNASGSTAVLLAASVLKGYRFENTIVYVLFTGEEQGLIGSHYFVQALAGMGKNVLGALNFDMIAYDGNADGWMEVYCGSMAESGAMADLLVETIGRYSLPLAPHKYTTGGAGWSDHSRFWDAGYPAIVGIEDNGADFNPYYHTINDTRAICNPGYATQCVKAAAGTLARVAVPSGEGPTPGPTPTPSPTPEAQAGITLNGTSFAAGDSFTSRFILNRSIERLFTAYAVIILPDGSMLDAITLGPVTPVASSVHGLASPFTYPLLSTTVFPGAPTGAYEIVAAFFDPCRPITGRGDAFMEAAARFTIR
ncbi:MAG: M28 family metallopeptidase [Chlamydiota bacterium]